VDAADAGPEGVARSEDVALGVGLRLDLSFEDHVRLHERVVLEMCHAAGPVFDHEHRVQLGVEALVDEHFHRDPAVREERRRHACRDGRLLDRGADLQPVEFHLAIVEAKQVPGTGVANLEGGGFVGIRRSPDEERVVPAGAGDARLWRVHVDTACSVTVRPDPRELNADGHDAAGTGPEAVGAAVEQ
jgi:hypothetical protein